MEPSRTVYLLYGDDDLAMGETLQQMEHKLGDPSLAAMNTQRFSAPGLDLPSLEAAAAAVPFLAARRIIIVHSAERLPSDDATRTRFEQILDRLPDTTAFVLLEKVELPRYRRHEEEQKHLRSCFLHQWAKAHPERSYVRKFEKPTGAEFVRWVSQRCQMLGGEIDGHAAAMIAELVAEDLHLANMELAKLLDFVDRARPIRATDVESLTPFHGQSDVFAMVDAVGLRDARRALAHLHRLLEENDPLYILSMIVRQFRLLLQAREALDGGRDPHQLMREKPFVIDKAIQQARNFSLAELETIYHELLAIDLSNKRGLSALPTSLDLLVARVTA
jgi:DNA polymerase-3 subunit delta